MSNSDTSNRLSFIRTAGKLKDTARSARTNSGKLESVAEHTWRLTLLAISYADQFPDIDTLKLLKICILHDLGEIIGGDIPAPEQHTSKSAGERQDFISLLHSLPADLQQQFTDLWDDYDNRTSKEAKVAKAFDKIETLLQHNQGKNRADFDYAFNLEYGRRDTDAFELTRALRAEIDEGTRRRAEASLPRDNITPVELKAFVPATDYKLSKSFYRDIGFQLSSDTAGVAYFVLDNCSFLLQQVDALPGTPVMMHLLVESVDAWQRKLRNQHIDDKYGTDIPDINTQPWGMREFILTDPCGVCWRIAENITHPANQENRNAHR
jgi:putative hydrolase of HD superfamily